MKPIVREASGVRSTATSGSSTAGAREGWLAVLAVFCGVMVSFGSLLVFTFSVFVKPLSAEFGWSRERISAAFGIAAMTVAVCSPVLGRLLDRYGAKRVVLPCMVVFGAAFASLTWLTPNLAHYYAVFFVLGVVGNGTTQMGYSRAVSPARVGRRRPAAHGTRAANREEGASAPAEPNAATRTALHSKVLDKLAATR